MSLNQYKRTLYIAHGNENPSKYKITQLNRISMNLKTGESGISASNELSIGITRSLIQRNFFTDQMLSVTALH